MSGTAPGAAVSVLWEVEWAGARLRCAVYREGSGLCLRVESGDAVIVEEPFVIEPRAMRRARLLQRSLVRRGWRDAAAPTGAPPSPGS